VTPVFYTGVGSRKTPADVQGYMRVLAQRLAIAGWTLRSGAAPGADYAFEYGCEEWGGAKEIYLPWRKFNGHASELYRIPDVARFIASKLHPAWLRCGGGARSMHARDVLQVTGQDPQRPELSKFVVCWTPDGAQTTDECTIDTGGTGMAIRVASLHNVPVFNLARPSAGVALWSEIVKWTPTA
jgi:hypothetical protein